MYLLASSPCNLFRNMTCSVSTPSLAYQFSIGTPLVCLIDRNNCLECIPPTNNQQTDMSRNLNQRIQMGLKK